MIVDMDGGYGNIFNVQRTTELYVTAGVAAAHLEDQVLPKRCGQSAARLIPVNEMLGKLRMARAVADELGNRDFVVIARTDGLSAGDAPGTCSGANSRTRISSRSRPSPARSKSGSRRPALAFNWSSSFKWYADPNPISFRELGQIGVKFIFITLGAQHATGHGLGLLLRAMAEREEQGYIDLQRQEWQPRTDLPTRSHHFFSGAPYHHLVGNLYDAARLGTVRRAAARREGRLAGSSPFNGPTRGEWD